MAGKENPRKRKLNMEASQIEGEDNSLSHGSKLLEFVSRGQINNVTDSLKLTSKNSKSFNAAFIKAAELGHKRILQKFIETGATVNRKNFLGNTALHIACMHGFIDLVKLLVRNGSDVDCQNKDGQTALLLAVEKACSLPLVEYLTSGECCANVNIQDCHGRTALMVATSLQDLCGMKLLMAHKEIQLGLKDENGKTAFDIAKDCGLKELFSIFKACFRREVTVSPLVMAVKKNSVTLVQTVLYTLSSEEVNTLDASLFSPLMISLSNKAVNIEIVSLLLKAGAKVNLGSANDNITPLFLACRTGSLEAVKLLVKEGADVNTQTAHRKLTPLMCACENNKIEIVKFLIKHKADMYLSNSNSETALLVALGCKNKICAEELIKSGAEINDAVFHLAVKAGWHNMLPNVEVISKDVINEALVLACKKNNYELAKFLLEKGAQVNQAGHNVPLILALHNVKLVHLLIRFGADVNLKNSSGSFPLAEAVNQDNILVLETLIKHGADLDAVDHSGCTALMMAASNEKLNIMKVLLDAGSDINFASTDYHESALNAALSSYKTEAIKLLLTRGAHVNHKVNSPLLQSLRGESIHLEMLLNHGADPNLLFPDGSTVLLKALEARCNHSQIKLLLNFGADPNTRNKDGESAVIVAAKYCTTMVIELLIKSGADMINAIDKNGSTVLLCAVAHSIASDNKIAFLINCGADVNKGNHDGDNPLIAATRCCNLNIIQLLVYKGANVDAQDQKGMTALMHAVSTDSYKKVKFLIDSNTNLNLQSITGLTASMLAVVCYRPAILKALLDAGADINVVNAKGNTALSVALSYLHGHSPSNIVSERLACLKLLILAGAKPDLQNYRNALLFHKLIASYDEPELIDVFIKTGAPPPLVSVDNLRSICCVPFYYYILCEQERKVSPLLTAMFSKNINLALYFLKYWYLDKSDILFLHKNMVHNQIYIRHLSNNSFLGVIRQPFSLKCLSFVVVSTAVGNHPDRVSRVNSLPVPAVIKSSLLFQLQGQCLVDKRDQDSAQRLEFTNYNQQGFVGLDFMD